MNQPNQISQIDDLSSLPDVPSTIVSMDGQQIDSSGNKWRMRMSADGGGWRSINWELLDPRPRAPLLSSRTERLIRLYLVDRISRRKALTVLTDFKMFCRFFRWLVKYGDQSSFDWVDFDEGMGRSYLDFSLRQTADKGNCFSRLRNFYRWGVAHQYPDFDRLRLQALLSITAPGNPSGHNVRSRDPIKGPLSPDERLLVARAIATGQGTVRDRAIVMLHLELGINPNASARLKNKDFKRYCDGEAIAYQLAVPRMKKRTAYRETKQRPISHELGQLLDSLQQGEPEDPLLHWANGSAPELAINEATKRFAKAADLISPRTGKNLHLSPRRFRTTLATHMAEEGASKYQIAEILDHSDLNNVRVYVEVASTITDQVAAATDTALQPLVNRFLGKITDASKPQAFDGMPNQVIPSFVPHLPLPALNTGGVGFCGRDVRENGLCRLFPPLSCYMCPSFAALRDGPHHDLLESLIAYMQAIVEQADQRIIKQLEDICLAIKEVLRQIESDGRHQISKE
jgi:integrase